MSDALNKFKENIAKRSKEKTQAWVDSTSALPPIEPTLAKESVSTPLLDAQTSNEPGFLEKYSNAFTSGLQGGIDKFGQAYNQFSEGKVGAGFLNTLTGAGLTIGSPIIGAFGVGSQIAEDVFGKGARQNLDAVLDPVGSGAALLDQGFKKVGIDTKKIDSSLGLDGEFGQAAKDATHLVGTGLAFGIGGKLMPKKQTVPTVPMRDIRSEKIAEVKEVREKGYSATTEPVVAKAKRADVKSQEYNEPKRVEYEKEKTVTETADINRSKRTDVTDKYTEDTKSQQVGDTIELPKDAANTEQILAEKSPITKPKALSENVLGQEFTGNSHLEIFENARKALAPEKTIDEFMDIVQKDVDAKRQERLDNKVAEIKAKNGEQNVIQEMQGQQEVKQQKDNTYDSYENILSEARNFPRHLNSFFAGVRPEDVGTVLKKVKNFAETREKNDPLMPIIQEQLPKINELIAREKQVADIAFNKIMDGWGIERPKVETVTKPSSQEAVSVTSPTLERLKSEVQQEMNFGMGLGFNNFKQMSPREIVKTFKENTEVFNNVIKYGSDLIQQGYNTFRGFAQKVINMFGEGIRPMLRKLWQGSQKQMKEQSPEAQKMTEVLKNAKVDRAKTDKMYAEERGKKYAKLLDALQTGGEQKYFEALKSQKGELPKADFEPVKQKFSQVEIDNLYNEIGKSSLNGWEQLSAMHGLTKVFGEQGGKVPTLRELDLLKQVYGEQFVESLQGKLPWSTKIKNFAVDAINIPRALVTSFDMSAPLRQGLVLTISKPRQAFGAMKSMHKYFFSKKAYEALETDLRNRPNTQLYEKSGLYIAKETMDITKREESFMSHIAEKLPLFGSVVRASERAYVGYLNKLRADVFDSISKNFEKEGISYENNPKAYQDIANFINLASGRGDLGKYGNRVAPVLNGAFFSIRNLAAKVQLLNPMTYAKMEKTARIEAIKSMVATVGTIGTLVGLADQIEGVTVEKDPRSSDFMKIRYKDTRVDPWGGFQQFVRFTAQMVSGEVKSSTSGKVRELSNTEFPFETRKDRLYSFVESKFSPQLSIGMDVLRGQNIFGEDFKFTADNWNEFTETEYFKRLAPLYVQDIMEASQELGLAPSAIFTMLSFYGAGLQTYKKDIKPKLDIQPPDLKR